MSRYRLHPDARQEEALLVHCGHARYVWDLAVEQQSWWTPRRGPAPGYGEWNRQLTEARRAFDWLAAGSVIVAQQVLRDFSTAMANFFRGTHRKPTVRKRGQHEGFRIVAVKPGDVRQINRRWSEVRVPKVGWVRFRWTRRVPVFRCVSCGHTANADINAALNIAAGRAVTARGGCPLGQPVNREPQHCAPPSTGV
ncbi:zinc ribbon domain-containing protein [Frankia sp. Cppng1_Ct_nod]|uniref:zinc ribbon domain-containing protein n=1 Tax=Frankia sp. Cppng1_Ct_nod TaxID=2897162 RepID=UPI001041793F|nr:zinc ribbon domain-containing protein [Frankia sp. Cppng1_Ct_nod]